MSKQRLHPRRARRGQWLVALGASALAHRWPAGRRYKASIACRGANRERVLSGIRSLAIIAERQVPNRLRTSCCGGPPGACNDVSNSLFDPKGPVSEGEGKSAALIPNRGVLPGIPS